MSNIKIDKKLYFTKPTDGNRLDKEMDTYHLLEELSISYLRIDHEPTATIEDCSEVEFILGIEIFKNLFLCNRQQTEFYLLVMSGKKKFVTKEVSKEIGSSRLSFAKDEHMKKYLDSTPGSVSILGLMNDKDRKVHLLMDKEVVQSEYFACHPCINTSSLKLKTSDILKKFLPHTGHKPYIIEL